MNVFMCAKNIQIQPNTLLDIEKDISLAQRGRKLFEMPRFDFCF